MKKIIILSIGLFILTIYGLNAQENQNSEPKYRFFNEYGFFTGSTWTKTENGGDIGISGIFVNGVQVDKTHFVGFGLGYESGLEIGQGIPFFINYRHFFDKGYKIKPFMNVAVGTRFAFWEEEQYYKDEFGYTTFMDPPISRNGLGFYSTLGVGFTSHAFSFTSSIFYRTRPGENLNGVRSFTGIEVKVGFSL